MIERVRIADIMTPADEVIFYDPAMDEKLRQFCKERAISYLPSLENPNSEVYCKRADNTFEVRTIKIDEDLRVDADVDVFSEQALGKFEDHKVLFVYQHGEFCGVVHFSDYNKDVINIYLYKLISRYEKILRDFLRNSNYNNNHMKEFFEINKKIFPSSKDHYESRLRYYNRRYKDGSLDKKPQFDIFYIDDLIELLNSKIENIKLDLQVKELRNSIMHTNETINKDQEGGGLIFDIQQFSTFFRRVQILKKDTRKVRTRLQLLSMNK